MNDTEGLGLNVGGQICERGRGGDRVSMMSKRHETRTETSATSYSEELLAGRIAQEKKESERLLSCVR